MRLGKWATQPDGIDLCEVIEDICRRYDEDDSPEQLYDCVMEFAQYAIIVGQQERDEDSPEEQSQQEQETVVIEKDSYYAKIAEEDEKLSNNEEELNKILYELEGIYEERLLEWQQSHQSPEDIESWLRKHNHLNEHAHTLQPCRKHIYQPLGCMMFCEKYGTRRAEGYSDTVMVEDGNWYQNSFSIHIERKKPMAEITAKQIFRLHGVVRLKTVSDQVIGAFESVGKAAHAKERMVGDYWTRPNKWKAWGVSMFCPERQVKNRTIEKSFTGRGNEKIYQKSGLRTVIKEEITPPDLFEL